MESTQCSARNSANAHMTATVSPTITSAADYFTIPYAASAAAMAVRTMRITESKLMIYRLFCAHSVCAYAPAKVLYTASSSFMESGEPAPPMLELCTISVTVMSFAVSM